MITLIALSRLTAMEPNTKKKARTMKTLTHFKKTKILRSIFLSLGAIFALVTAAHAQNLNLYVSAQVPPSHAILEFTPDWDAEYLRFGVVVPPRVGL